MTNFNTELITALSQGINIDEIFRKQLEEAMNLLLETQRTAFYNTFYAETKTRQNAFNRTEKILAI